MKVTMLWFGGSSYAAPTLEEAETFSSLKTALEVCESRYENRDGSTPCANEYYGDYPATVAHVYFGESVGDYPDREIVVTRRGTFRAVRC